MSQQLINAAKSAIEFIEDAGSYESDPQLRKISDQLSAGIKDAESNVEHVTLAKIIKGDKSGATAILHNLETAALMEFSQYIHDLRELLDEELQGKSRNGA